MLRPMFSASKKTPMTTPYRRCGTVSTILVLLTSYRAPVLVPWGYGETAATTNVLTISSMNRPDKHKRTSKQAFYQRAHDNRKAGKLFSRKIGYTRLPNGRTISRLLPVCAKLVWSKAQDDLKAPMNNEANPAMFSPASLNLYFGQNTKAEGQTLRRTAYGTGSGATSIGLNPETMKIHHIFPQLASLVREVTKVLVSKDSAWARHLEEHPFNFVGIKIYYTYRKQDGTLVRKCTRYHVDVTRNRKTGEPMPNNSQVPGTPVAILTYGASKNLWFRRQKTKQLHNPTSLIHFLQRSGSLFVLDGRDEELDKHGYHWRHMSDMGPDTEGITYSFSLRSVQEKQQVNGDGTLASPHVTNKMRDTYTKGEAIFQTNHYKQSKTDLDQRMLGFLKTKQSSS